MTGFHVEGRRWVDSYGNTYHVVRVYHGGACVVHSEEMGYGYGDQYLVTAGALLEDAGLLKCDRFLSAKDLRERYAATYSVVDVRRRKDLGV